MKKAFDQTVRDLKRGVNKKVLKVPGIEQKVLDATSNEPWGPHGSLLADIAHASRNYHEYQMIMSVLWKRINDTGKNWRHVYKALTALEYLVAHGSERVTDEIKEHAYQLSTLSRFHYIDSNGRDQGNNVRKKSQNLVDLVNDKERISEVRQKAATNRDKFRSMPSGMYRPGDRYDDERNEGQYMDDDRNGSGYGRERDYNHRDNDGYGKYGDLYSRDGDRYGRDNEDRCSQESYRDDDYQGRSRTYDGYSSRSRSADRDRDRGDNDDAQFSSRGSGGRADEQSQNGRGLERKYSEQNIGAPPSYEEAVGDSRSPAYSERNRENPAASVPESVSPPAPQAAAPSPRVASPSAPKAASLTEADNTSHEANPFGPSASSPGQETEVFDEFDPRNPFRAGSDVTAAPTNPSIPTTSSNAEMELLGSLSDSFSGNPLATVPTTSEADVQPKFSGSEFGATQSASNPVSQSFEDPFGEAPFRAFPSQDTSLDPQQPTVSALPFQPTASPNVDQFNAIASKPDTANNFGFGDSISATTYSGSNAYSPPTNLQFSPQDMSASSQETDILAGVLPPPGPSHVVPQAGFSVPMGQTTAGQLDCGAYGGFNPQAGSAVPTNAGVGPQALQYSGGTFVSQGGSAAPSQSNMHPATPAGAAMHFNNGNFLPQHGSPFPAMPQNNGHSATGQGPQFTSANFAQPSSMNLAVSKVSNQNLAAQPSQNGNDVFGGFFLQGSSNPVGTPAGVPSYTGALAIVPQPSKDKFETKSTVWKDTLSRGLVNLNISGPKTNPLSDIGIDFDALNRREKRMEKQTTPAVTSTVTMGKAMGSGSGIGRAGASTLRPQTSMMNPGMNMGTGMGGVPGAGMGYGGVLPGMGMNMGMNPGMGVNMRMAQGAQMRPQAGYVPGSTMPGGYNPIMGMSGYTPQQPYGGGYHQ